MEAYGGFHRRLNGAVVERVLLEETLAALVAPPLPPRSLRASLALGVVGAHEGERFRRLLAELGELRSQAWRVAEAARRTLLTQQGVENAPLPLPPSLTPTPAAVRSHLEVERTALRLQVVWLELATQRLGGLVASWELEEELAAIHRNGLLARGRLELLEIQLAALGPLLPPLQPMPTAATPPPPVPAMLPRTGFRRRCRTPLRR